MRKIKPDIQNAFSLIGAAKQQMDFTLSLPVDSRSAATITRNIYECFRMLGSAILLSKGIKAEDHVLPITEISNVKINSTRPISSVQNLRNLRHNINYNGYNPTNAEVNDAISIAKECFYLAYDKIKKELEFK